MEQRKAAGDEELLSVVYRQEHQEPAGPAKIQQEIQEHPDTQGGRVQRSEITQGSLIQHTSSGKSKLEQTIGLREGGATFTQTELQGILITISINGEELNQDTATANPA